MTEHALQTAAAKATTGTTDGTGDVAENPAWPDATIEAHPDGMAWRKACRGCIFKRHNPQRLDDREWDAFTVEMAFEGYVFFCEHRSDGGAMRQCASHAAYERTRARTGA